MNYAEAMSRFSCRDKSVEYFLRNKAFDFDVRNVARTYLILDPDEYVLDDVVILAYFSISVKHVIFDETLSKTKINEIDGFSKNAPSANTILIGQLGKDTEHSNEISGSLILDLAIAQVYSALDTVGCRIALLECMPIDKLLDFYKSNGFVFLQQSRDNELLQLIRFL
ncbi:hypothetical protein AGMMS49975_15730 [Clostridia bacterium]|nr:hypothetical protein AGMMS49975_15730 [Clostridia bacterium]